MPRKKSDLLSIFSEYSPQLLTIGQIRMECPFRENHSDGSGRMSFFVSPEINAYHCFAGETRVPTNEGTFEIRELVGKTVEVLSNGTFVKAKFKSYGVQPLLELHLSRDRVQKIIRVS